MTTFCMWCGCPVRDGDTHAVLEIKSTPLADGRGVHLEPTVTCRVNMIVHQPRYLGVVEG